MNQFKRAQVIVLPTDNTVNVLKGYKDKTLLFKFKEQYKTLEAEKPYVSNFHLYIISDDEKKDGDWCYDKSNYKIVRYSHKILGLYFVRGIKHLKEHEGYSVDKDDLKKIIATTDTSLKEIIKNHNDFDSVFSYPQPSQQFIEKYIESYNKGEVITDVLVEYEKIYNGYRHKDGEWQLKLKINPKDNTITIKKLKDSWNKDEVRGLLIKFHNEFPNRFDIDNWIKKNL